MTFFEVFSEYIRVHKYMKGKDIPNEIPNDFFKVYTDLYSQDMIQLEI